MKMTVEMKQVRTVRSLSHSDLEDRVNKILKSIWERGFRVSDVKYSSFFDAQEEGYDYSAMILFEEVRG